jgi:hypothetical protein
MSRRIQELNPLADLEKIWKIAERITKAVAFVMVFGTISYVSIHALA